MFSDDERRELEARFRSEAAAEHQKRMEKAQNPDRPDAEPVDFRDRGSEMAKLRGQVREEFFVAHGYVKYRDTRGAEIWLTVDEVERRNRRKKRRKNNQPENRDSPVRRIAVLIGVVVLAVVVGLALGSR